MKPEATDLPAVAAYYEGYADGMTAVVERWSKSLGWTRRSETLIEVADRRSLGDQLEADHAKHRTAESDLREDR